MIFILAAVVAALAALLLAGCQEGSLYSAQLKNFEGLPPDPL